MYVGSDPDFFAGLEQLNETEIFIANALLTLTSSAMDNVLLETPLDLETISEMKVAADSPRTSKAIQKLINSKSSMVNELESDLVSKISSKEKIGRMKATLSGIDNGDRINILIERIEDISSIIDDLNSESATEIISLLNKTLTFYMFFSGSDLKQIFFNTYYCVINKKFDLKMIFRISKDTSFYIVKMNVTPFFIKNTTKIPIPNDLSGKIRVLKSDRDQISFINDGHQSNKEGFCEGISVGVRARCPSGAVFEAQDIARQYLDYLRGCYCVNVVLQGPVSVLDSLKDETRWFSLRQPTWAGRDTMVRAIPAMPRFNFNGKVPQTDTPLSRWESCRWHISTAIALWSEDPYLAAAEIWQAIEALIPESSGGAVARIDNVIEKVSIQYYQSVISFWKKQNGSQRRKTPKSLQENFWYRSLNIDKLIWICGKTDILSHCRESIRENVYLLYLLRNAVVHQGNRRFPPQLAEHLAESGLEFIAAYAAADVRTAP